MATARDINTHRGEGGDLDKGLEVLQLAGLMEILPQPSQRQRHILRTPQMKTSINTTTSEQGRPEFFSVFTTISSKVKWCMADWSQSQSIIFGSNLSLKNCLIIYYLYYAEQFSGVYKFYSTQEKHTENLTTL